MLQLLGLEVADTRPLWLVVVSVGSGFMRARDEVYVHANSEGEAKAAANRVTKRSHPGSPVVTVSVERITEGSGVDEQATRAPVAHQ